MVHIQRRLHKIQKTNSFSLPFLLSINCGFRELARGCEMLIDFEYKNNYLMESRSKGRYMRWAIRSVSMGIHHHPRIALNGGRCHGCNTWYDRSHMVQFQFSIAGTLKEAAHILGLITGFFISIAILLEPSYAIWHFWTPETSKQCSSKDTTDVHNSRVETLFRRRQKGETLIGDTQNQSYTHKVTIWGQNACKTSDAQGTMQSLIRYFASDHIDLREGMMCNSGVQFFDSKVVQCGE